MATKCPVSRDQFTAHAAPLPVAINGVTYTAKPMQFTTGSMGWNINQKITLLVDGKECLCQCGLNITVIGSKLLPGAPEE